MGCGEHSLKWSREIIHPVTENDYKWNSRDWKLEAKKLLASQEILVSPTPASLDAPAAHLSPGTSFLCASTLPWPQNGHPTCQGQPPISSASWLLNSTHTWEKKATGQDALSQWSYTNEKSQRSLFPPSQVWPGVQQDCVEQRSWDISRENSVAGTCKNDVSG